MRFRLHIGCVRSGPWLRLPEHRFAIDSMAEARIGRNFRRESRSLWNGARRIGCTLVAARTAATTFEMRMRIRAGETAGAVPFDELFQLGVERDNDLWLRGHAGTSGGVKALRRWVDAIF